MTLVDTRFPADRGRVIASIERIGRSASDVAAVVLTHAHPDHLGNAEYFRTAPFKSVWVHEREPANAIGKRVEQVSTSAVLRMAWRPDVFVWFVDTLRLKVGQVKRLAGMQTFDEGVLGGLLGVPGDYFQCPRRVTRRSLQLPSARTRRPAGGDAPMTEHPWSVRIRGVCCLRSSTPIRVRHVSRCYGSRRCRQTSSYPVTARRSGAAQNGPSPQRCQLRVDATGSGQNAAPCARADIGRLLPAARIGPSRHRCLPHSPPGDGRAGQYR